jgi:predicted DNA-binding protein with PD1-like motif
MIFHIHMCLIDPEKPRESIGGHLEEGIVWATVEIYIGELSYQLDRIIDPETGGSALRTT